MGLAVADDANGLMIVRATAPFCAHALAKGKHHKPASADQDQQSDE
jgi:hypothetical protein